MYGELLLLTGTILGRTRIGLGPGPWGSCAFWSWEQTFYLKMLWLPIPGCCVSTCNVLENSCVPFMQHCLISFLLNSSHCVIISDDFIGVSIVPLEIVYKMLYFQIRLSGMRQWLMQDSPIPVSSVSFSWMAPPLFCNSLHYFQCGSHSSCIK